MTLSIRFVIGFGVHALFDRFLLSILLSGVVFALPQYAWGQDSFSDLLEFKWRAPESCPLREDVLRDIESMVEREVAQKQEPVWAEGIISEEAGRYNLLITTRQRRQIGQRQVPGDSCKTLARLAAYIVAVLLDPSAEMPDLEAEPEPPAPTPEPPPIEEPEIKPEPPPVPSLGEGSLWFAAFGGVAQFGVLPKVSGGGVVMLGRRFGKWELVLDALFVAPRSDTVTGLTTITGTFHHWQLGLDGRRVLLRTRRWDLGIALGSALGAIVGDADSAGASKERALWWELRGGSFVRYWLSPRWTLLGVVEGGLALRRDRFNVAGFGQLYRPKLGLGRLKLTVEVHF